MKNILLHGLPGIGKTTLLQSLSNRLSSHQLGGFYTKEIRERSRRIGFSIETFDNKSAILSHVTYKNSPRVGKYGIDVATFEKIAVTDLERSLTKSDIIIIDEIGKMELFSLKFQEIVIRCLDSDKNVVAAVMTRSHPFVDQIKSRSDVRIFEVTIKNRNILINNLLAEIFS
jgi:nucleoside-triphosphatase THEP1